MSINITMPALSPTMEEGTLAKWLVKEGDRVEAGDIIAEIETDKATMEVEAVDEGIIGKILVPEGSEGVKVNAPIAVLLEEGESVADISSASPPQPSAAREAGVVPEATSTPGSESTSTPGSESTSTPSSGLTSASRPEPTSFPRPEPTSFSRPKPVEGREETKLVTKRIFATPLARRLAKEANIDLRQISGSGPRGRIIKADIERAKIEGVTSKPQALAASGAKIASGMGADEVLALYEEGSYEARKNDGMRTVVAQRLTEAKQTIPHFYLNIECKLDNLLAARAKINESAPKDKDGKPQFKLSVNDFIIKAWALALQKVPDGNATWAGDSILYHRRSDVAVAVAVPGGLFTPVIRAAEAKSLRQISDEVKDFAMRAKSKKLAPHEYQGGSSAVSNLGMYGIKQFAAVINPPHGTILAIGAGEKRVFVENDEIKTGVVMDVTLSCDHRSVDGALGALMLQAFKQFIENPVLMLA